MRGLGRRGWSLLSRYRTDRRLPPNVKELLKTTTTGRVTEAAQWVRRSNPAPNGQLHVPTDTLALDAAARVVEVLEAHAIDIFVVERRLEGGERPRNGETVRRLDGLRFGVALQDRGAALAALVGALAAESGWHLQWHDGMRQGTMPLARAAKSRHVRRARSWNVHLVVGIGERPIGAEQGAELTFWGPGPSGQVEMVGTRHHERFHSESPRTTEKIGGHAFPGRAAFPVETGFDSLHADVDVVYTWVDGADPAWQEAFRATAEAEGRDVGESALDPARFRSRDELRYSLRSLWAYCGWVRHVWIVTAGQRPTWLVDDEGVTVVDHSEIMPAAALPTFNSHAIEASLHRIEGLAEHFVYLNDDFMIARPLRPEVFFEPNGLPHVFVSEARIPSIETSTTLAADTAARRGQEFFASTFGRVPAFKLMHAPYPLRRSLVRAAEDEAGEAFTATVCSRFRSPSDLSVASSFAQYYALAHGNAVTAPLRAGYAHVESGRLSLLLDYLRLSDDLDSFCINESADDNAGAAERDDRIRQFFDAIFPIPAPWERI